MHLGLIIGLVIGVTTLFILIAVAVRFYQHLNAPDRRDHHYDLPPPIQATRQVSWRGSQHQHPQQQQSTLRDTGEAERQSVLSAMASPSMGSPITATATTFNFSRLSVPGNTPMHPSVERLRQEEPREMEGAVVR